MTLVYLESFLSETRSDPERQIVIQTGSALSAAIEQALGYTLINTDPVEPIRRTGAITRRQENLEEVARRQHSEGN
jgi:hypothetical protein